MPVDRDRRQLQLRFTVAATLLLALCALLLAANLLRRTTSNPPPGDVPLSALTGGAAPTELGIEGFLDATIAELTDAARGHGDDPADVLPTDQERQRALASGDFDSAASQNVLIRLRDGYQRYGLPFPGGEQIHDDDSPRDPR
ncbi:MAG: hypothetical protein QGH45_22440 [Myxococcota bacterium]|nr:hypothetical protein [Myxococcota bacterium]